MDETMKAAPVRKEDLPDIQKTKDRRGISINRVGVSKIDFPLYVKARGESEPVLVYTSVDLYSSLKHNVKGTNMSRFLEQLMEYKYETIDATVLKKFLTDLKSRLGNVADVYASIRFKYFMSKVSPASGQESVMGYDCILEGKLSAKYSYRMGVEVLTTSNCPCSKEISRHGAHGQRSRIRVAIQPDKGKTVFFEDLIELVEKEGSCEIYPLLKRVDEKYVTERAYENPKFVEDEARDIAVALEQSGKFNWFKIKVSNEESIHTHDAVCYIERYRKGRGFRKALKNLRQL